MTTFLSKPLSPLAVYNPSKPWEHNILKIVDLSKIMKRFDAQKIFDALERIQAYEDDLRMRVVQEGRGDETVSQAEKDRLGKLLDEHISYAFHPDEFTKIADAAYLLWPRVERDKLKLFDLFGQFAGFRMAVHMELFSRLLLVIDPQKAPFYGRKKAFGEGVDGSFPAARRDITEAGNCYALDLHTACVFHLMRVLEKGLRAMARQLGVPCEIENWHHMIQDIESATRRVEQEPRSPERQRKLKFYGDRATELAFFKHAWRDHVMHAQTEYGQQEALQIMGHVEAFMQKLAEEIIVDF